MIMRRNKTSSPSFHRALHATAMFCATVAALLLVSRAAGSPAPLERASYRPVDQGLATPESYNRTRRDDVRGWERGETVIRTAPLEAIACWPHRAVLFVYASLAC